MDRWALYPARRAPCAAAAGSAATPEEAYRGGADKAVHDLLPRPGLCKTARDGDFHERHAP